MLLLSSAIAFALHILPVHSFSVLCALDIYGKPQVDDSYEIVTKLPFLSDDPYHDLTKHRVFAEPAYLQPRFSQLVNPFESSMVQLPKIWRTSQSHLRCFFAMVELTVAFGRICAHGFAELRRRVWPGTSSNDGNRLEERQDFCGWSPSVLHLRARRERRGLFDQW